MADFRDMLEKLSREYMRLSEQQAEIQTEADQLLEENDTEENRSIAYDYPELFEI